MNDIDFKSWFYVAAADLCVCVPAKCGGTSFYRRAFSLPDCVPDEHARSFAVSAARDQGAGPFAPHEVAEYFPDTRKLLALREPVARFKSLWRDKCRRRPGPTLNSTEYLRGWTQEQLIELIASHPYGDPHWVPQSSHVVPGVELIDCVTLGERLNWCEKREKRENRTEPLSTDPEPPRDAILKHYLRDAELWASL